MKTKTINLEGDYVDFEREWIAGQYKLIAKIGGRTSKDNATYVNVKLDFDCLPYIMPGIAKAWELERDRRTTDIARIDKVLGL